MEQTSRLGVLVLLAQSLKTRLVLHGSSRAAILLADGPALAPDGLHHLGTLAFARTATHSLVDHACMLGQQALLLARVDVRLLYLLQVEKIDDLPRRG